VTVGTRCCGGLAEDLAATFVDEDIGKLVTQYDRRPNLHGDYVEK
jgi:hypothetical protein